jgi:hypothetical protein
MIIARALRPVLVVASLLLALTQVRPVAASEPCNPPNVIPQPVCDFDSFRGSPPRQIPNGWTEFILSGDPTYMQDSDTFWGPPSLRMWSSGGTFKAGIYSQVQVTPGAGYRASISWGAPNAPDTFGRQLGIDPTGGTDPNSPSVIWGPMHWGPGRILNYPPPDVNIDVRARAISATITVFFLVDHPNSTGDNLIFIDALALYPDESAPAVDLPTPPTPTVTPEPPIATPAPAVIAAVVQPTAVPTDTPLPTETPTTTPTATPEPPTATPVPTATETPTVTPTWTPWPTVTAAPAQMNALPGSEQLLDLARSNQPRTLWILGIAGFLGAGLFGVGLVVVRRR